MTGTIIKIISNLIYGRISFDVLKDIVDNFSKLYTKAFTNQLLHEKIDKSEYEQIIDSSLKESINTISNKYLKGDIFNEKYNSKDYDLLIELYTLIDNSISKKLGFKIDTKWTEKKQNIWNDVLFDLVDDSLNDYEYRTGEHFYDYKEMLIQNIVDCTLEKILQEYDNSLIFMEYNNDYSNVLNNCLKVEVEAFKEKKKRKDELHQFIRDNDLPYKIYFIFQNLHLIFDKENIEKKYILTDYATIKIDTQYYDDTIKNDKDIFFVYNNQYTITFKRQYTSIPDESDYWHTYTLLDENDKILLNFTFNIGYDEFEDREVKHAVIKSFHKDDWVEEILALYEIFNRQEKQRKVEEGKKKFNEEIESFS